MISERRTNMMKASVLSGATESKQSLSRLYSQRSFSWLSKYLKDAELDLHSGNLCAMIHCKCHLLIYFASCTAWQEHTEMETVRASSIKKIKRTCPFKAGLNQECHSPGQIILLILHLPINFSGQSVASSRWIRLFNFTRICYLDTAPGLYLLYWLENM